MQSFSVMCSSTEVTATSGLFKVCESGLVLFQDAILSSKKGCYQLTVCCRCAKPKLCYWHC